MSFIDFTQIFYHLKITNPRANYQNKIYLNTLMIYENFGFIVLLYTSLT